MTYIDLINNYWKVNREDPMNPLCAALYYYLLHVCNLRRWQNPFALKTKIIESELGVTRFTICNIRDELQKRGLIDFRVGKGSGAPFYTIVGVDDCVSVANTNEDKKQICVSSANTNEDSRSICVSSANTKPICVSVANTKVKKSGICVSSANTNQAQQAQRTLYSIDNINNNNNIYNNIYNNKKEKREKEKKRKESEPLIFSENELKEKKKKKIPAPPPPPPSLEDVKIYFLSQNADKRIDDWELQAELFFNVYDSQGWKTSRGGTVRKWESKANAWIFDKEIEQKKRQRAYEERKEETRSHSDRRGIDADGKKQKDWEASF